jgi:hypothetical protein
MGLMSGMGAACGPGGGGGGDTARRPTRRPHHHHIIIIALPDAPTRHARRTLVCLCQTHETMGMESQVHMVVDVRVSIQAEFALV